MTADVDPNLRGSLDRLEVYLRERLPADGGAAPPRVTALGAPDVLPAEPVQAGRPALYLTPRSVLLGPYGAVDGAPLACALCLAMRWQKLRVGPEREVLESGGRFVAVGIAPQLTPFALEAVWQLYAAPPPPIPATAAGLATVYDLSLETLGVRRFPLVADPACPVCGRPATDDADRARLDPRPVPKPAVDRYRPRPVTDYGLSVDAYANPVCGMLGAAATPSLDSTTTAPVAGHLPVRAFGRDLGLTWSGHADSYADSTLLGLLEGLERYAGAQQRRFRTLLVDSYRNLERDALDPRDCGMYAPELYRGAGSFTEFSADRPIPWVWGYSLRDRRPILVPERLVYYKGGPGPDNFVHECSNGCASGSRVEEAALFGMLELIERDAFLLAWYGKARLPEIDANSCRDPATRFMVDRISLYGYEVRLFDNRIDLPIPVVTAVGVRRDGGPGTLCFAAGAGLDPNDAVRAALCEIASYIPSLGARVRDRLPELDAMSRDFAAVRDLADHAALFGLPDMAHHADFLLAGNRRMEMTDLYSAWERERPRTLDLLDDMRYCTGQLVDAGFDVIVVDQTCAEQEQLGLRSVRVVVPGMLPIDFGWRRQRALRLPRMRTAFRRAGWRTTDLEPADLHLVPHPFP
jgi:ribosomal protein S12 methylthiotransferase accessory factor